MQVVIQQSNPLKLRLTVKSLASGRGLNLLVGIASSDTELDWMARKCLELRLFADEEGGGDRWQNPSKKR